MQFPVKFRTLLGAPRSVISGTFRKGMIKMYRK